VLSLSDDCERLSPTPRARCLAERWLLRGRGVVFLVGDVLAPGDGVALIVEFL
jgi:hypothetical protein